MKKQYQIKNPCKKNQLESKDDGINFNCQACSKNVKDFSNMEIGQLQEQIHDSINTCVKILPRQLSYLNQFFDSSKKAILYGSAIAMMSTSCNDRLIQNFGSSSGKVMLDKRSSKTGEISDDMIKGKLLDTYDRTPLIGANVEIIGYDLNTVTDIEGNFSLKIPESIGETARIKFEYLGYYSLEILVSKVRGKQIIVDMGHNATIGYLELER